MSSSLNTSHPASSLPPVKPEDEELMKFVALDDLIFSKDDLKRLALANKRRELLKTDLTWKYVLREGTEPIPIDLFIRLADRLGYEYICSQGKILKINGPSTAEATNLVEDDINEIL